MWASTITSVIPGLVNAFQNANPDAWVTDGPAIGNDSASALISVGYDGATDGKSVQGEMTQDSWNNLPEQYTVFCACTAIDGGDDQSVPREAAFALFNNCTDALALDPTLGGATLRATPHDITITQLADDSGRVCTIRFGVLIQGFSA